MINRCQWLLPKPASCRRWLQTGARPLRRAIMRLLEDALAERVLAGDLKEGDSAIVDVDANGNITVLNGNGEILTQAAPTVPSGIM